MRIYSLGLRQFNNSTFMGRQNYTDDEKQFLNVKRRIILKIHNIEKEEALNEWNYITNSTKANEKRILESGAKVDASGIYDDYVEFSKIKRKISDPKLLKMYRKVCSKYFHPNVSADALNKQQMKTESIVCNYRARVNGKVYSDGELLTMLETETDSNKLKQLYTARKVKNGDLVAPELIKLVRLRNRYAHKLGYSDYFAYQLEKSFGIKESKLFKLMDYIDKNTSDIYKTISDKENQKLAEVFGVSPEKLQPWHYYFSLISDPEKQLDKCFKNADDVTKAAFSMYKKMGWDIKSMPFTFDLFPHKHKKQNGYTISVDCNKDVRILTNIVPSMRSHVELMHELGHGVYHMGISDHLPYMEREFPSKVMTESVSMMMETIAAREEAYPKYLTVPKELAGQLSLWQTKQSLHITRLCLLLVDFEKQMYANPNQDLPKLWYKLNNKYFNRPIPKKLDNRWASERVHIVSNPVYYQNYLRAEIMASQIYDAASAKLGKLTENPNTAEFFRKNIFRYGSSLTEEQILKKLTGKGLDAAAFCKQFERLLH